MPKILCRSTGGKIDSILESRIVRSMTIADRNITEVEQGQTLPVYRSADFKVTRGANLGDGLADSAELELDDTYALSPAVRKLPLSIAATSDARRFRIAAGSEIGTVGADLWLDCSAIFMCPDGVTVEALILVETDDGFVSQVYMLPLADLEPRKEYSLVRVDRENASARLAEVACVSFTRGTRITMSNGAQKKIEDLAVGDMVLTRDNGPQVVRWIGAQTVRATGAFAPIVIRKGTLNNIDDLTLSPNHRLFIYQRRDTMRTGKAELLVPAKLLLNGDTVVQTDGGFVDYYQLLFDRHEIIYAEGIAAESLFVDTRIRPALPPEMQKRLVQDLPGQPDASLRAMELKEGMVEPRTAADMLRQSTSC